MSTTIWADELQLAPVRPKPRVDLTANTKHDEAIKVFRDIFAARKVVLGPLNPDTLTTAAMLGRTLIGASYFDEGESILKNTFSKQAAKSVLKLIIRPQKVQHRLLLRRVERLFLLEF